MFFPIFISVAGHSFSVDATIILVLNASFGLLIVLLAFSIPEVDKLYHIALNGSEEEKVAAAKILCGASLIYGWNIQVNIYFCPETVFS